MNLKKTAVVAMLILTAGCSHFLDQKLSPKTRVQTAVREDIPNLEVSLNYLPQSAIALATSLPKPSAPQSADDQAEVNEVLKAQKIRTSQDCVRARSEASISLENFFGPSNGPLTEEEVGQLNPFFEKIISDVSQVTKVAKSSYSLPRPYAENAAIQPCLPPDSTSSYPSGHATTSRVMAQVLDLILPADKALFDERANTIANDRVVAGMHRPSDIQAGKDLADQIFSVLGQQSKFAADLKLLENSVSAR